MKQPSKGKFNRLNGLIFEYEAMSQNGNVSFFEKTVFRSIANHYAHRKDYRLLLTVAEDALRHHPKSNDFLLLKAIALINLNEPVQAADILLALAADTDDFQLGTLYRAEALCRKGVGPGALPLLEQLLADIHGKPDTTRLLRQANSFLQLKQFAQTYDVLRNVLLQDPSNQHALDQIWVCVELSGKYEESLTLHQELIERSPYNGKAWHNLAFAYLNLEQKENALDAFEYAFISSPWLESAYREYAGLAFEMGRYRNALQCCQEMAENLDVDSDLLVRMGECYEKLGDVKIAKAMYQKSLGLDPFNANAYYRFGACLAIEKDYSRAEKLLREAIKNEDRREEFHLALAEVYQCLGKHHAALDHYNKAVELAPEEGQYWTELARFLLSSGATEKALEVLDEGMNYAFDADLLYCRSACLFLIGLRSEAFDQLEEALCEDFEAHSALFNWAPSLQDDDDIRRMIRDYEQ